MRRWSYCRPGRCSAGVCRCRPSPRSRFLARVSALASVFADPFRVERIERAALQFCATWRYFDTPALARELRRVRTMVRAEVCDSLRRAGIL